MKRYVASAIALLALVLVSVVGVYVSFSHLKEELQGVEVGDTAVAPSVQFFTSIEILPDGSTALSPHSCMVERGTILEVVSVYEDHVIAKLQTADSASNLLQKCEAGELVIFTRSEFFDFRERYEKRLRAEAAEAEAVKHVFPAEP